MTNEVKQYALGAKAMAPILGQFPNFSAIVLKLNITNGFLIAAEIKPNIIYLGESANE